MVLGAGTSRAIFQLYDQGFRRIKAIDFAASAREACIKYLHQRPEIIYLTQNFLDTCDDNEYDFILDKGFLDCLISDFENW